MGLKEYMLTSSPNNQFFSISVQLLGPTDQMRPLGIYYPPFR